MREKLAHPVVSIIVERHILGVSCVLMQRRRRKQTEPFFDYWELPQGRIHYGEGIIECAERELYEETGLKLVRVKNIRAKTYIQETETLLAFQPFLCVSEAGKKSYLWGLPRC